jgi:hypothetical protein
MARHAGIHKCNKPDCWKQGKELVKYELPLELVSVLKAEAKKLGISFEQLFSMILEDSVKKKVAFEEAILKIFAEASDEERKRIILTLLASLPVDLDKKTLPN